MHELSVTENILSLALHEAARVGATRITRVSVKVGEWSTFEPDHLDFCFGVLARGTAAEEAMLAVETVPVRYACASCGFEYQPVGGRFSCPTCSSAGGKLISGREFYIDSIEVQHADTCCSESSGGE